MLTITAKADFREVRRTQYLLIYFAETESYSVALPLVKQEIEELTALGKDFEGNRFQPYSVAHLKWREKHGLTALKNLKTKVGGMMDLYIDQDSNMVTVRDQFLKIAEGQQEHPKWKYHHLFMNVSDIATNKIAQAINIKLQIFLLK